MKKIQINGKTYNPIITEEYLLQRLQKLALAISNKYKNSPEPIVLLVVLKGGLYFGMSLSLELEKLGCKHSIEVIQATRYKSDGLTGKIKFLVKPKISLKDKKIILVEDLIDEGITLNFLADYLTQQGVSFECCVIAAKKKNQFKYPIEYKIIPRLLGPEWLVGFGMDSLGLYRGLSTIYVEKNNSSK